MSPVEKTLNDITEAIVFCTTFCAIKSKPVNVTVVVTCADGLSHEYERHLDDSHDSALSLLAIKQWKELRAK